MESFIAFLFVFSGVMNITLAYNAFRQSEKRKHGVLNYNRLRTRLSHLLRQWDKNGVECTHCKGTNGSHFLNCPHNQVNVIITRVEQQEAA